MKSMDSKTEYITNNLIVEANSLQTLSNFYNFAVQLFGDRSAKIPPKLHSLTINRRFLRSPTYIAILETSDYPLLDILIHKYIEESGKKKYITLHFTRGHVHKHKLWEDYWSREKRSGGR